MIDQYNVIEYLKGNNTPLNLSYVFRSKDDKGWILNKEVKFRLIANGKVITIPKGFFWDLSSVPKFLWWCLPPYGDFLFAALVHDYLYRTQYGVDKMGWYKARRFADREMLFWSNIVNGGRKIDNRLRYWGVRLGGSKVFKEY